MKWFCITLACLSVVAVIDCTPFPPFDFISEKVLPKHKEPEVPQEPQDDPKAIVDKIVKAIRDMIHGEAEKTEEIKGFQQQAEGVAGAAVPEAEAKLKEAQAKLEEAKKMVDAVNGPKTEEKPKNEEPIPEGGAPETVKERKRRAASPIDTKIGSGPKIEKRYQMSESGRPNFDKTSPGKFIKGTKGMVATCPHSEDGPVIIYIQKVNKLSFNDSEDCGEDCE